MLCPYPDCTGQVAEGQNFCHICGRSLDPASVALAKRATTGELDKLGAMTQPIASTPTPTPNLPPLHNYGNPQFQGAPQYPPQYPPPQPHVQGNWPPQGQITMPVTMPMPPSTPVSQQRDVPGRGSKVPLIILVLVLLVAGGLAAGYFALGWRLPSSGGNSSSTKVTPPSPQTFHLRLPVFDRDNYFVSDPIKGSNGVERRISSAALPYSTLQNGQTSGMTSMEIALQRADNPDFSNEATIMSINFVSAQGLADNLKSDMNSRYPGANYQIAVPEKGKSYEIADSQGWKLKITVDAVGLDTNATMSDGSASPYPTFTQLDVTAEVTPK